MLQNLQNRRREMKSLSSKLFFLLLLLVSTTLAIDPPVKLWEKWYYTSWDVAFFRDIEITLSGDLFVGCLIYDYTPPPILENYVALLIDQDGNVIWEVPHAYDGAQSYDGLVLADGSYVVTGSATDYSSSSTVGLYIHKIASDGSTEWTKLYDYPDTKEEGYGITCLPDGGFAVCGRVYGTGNWAGEAWILRTDAYGDTLWTNSWGTSIENYGKAILFNNDELVVLAKGEDDTLVTQGTHLLFYDLDGNYLRGTDYPELLWIPPGDMCLASDGGYIFVTETFPSIAHTDLYGEILWRYSIYADPNDENEGHCIRQTMDGGYIFSGWDGYNPWLGDDELTGREALLEPFPGGNTVGSKDYREGWLVRFDSEGNELWNINNIVSHDDYFYSVVQLPQGGYITGGIWEESGVYEGYLVRYAPETGIEVEEFSPSVTLDVSPNPFSTSLSISCSFPEPALIELSIYDLSGRLVENLPGGSVSSGEHSLIWNPAVSVPAGCYMVRLSSPFGVISERCVFLK